jgi:hypothetical protein
MKKAILLTLIAIFTAGPVLADGKCKYKSEPNSHGTCVPCKVGTGLVWLVKLPFRVVTATTVGLYELVTDQDLSGFEEGYNLI